MTQVKGLRADDLLDAMPRGLAGEEAVRLISALKLVAPDAGSIGPCLKGTH